MDCNHTSRMSDTNVKKYRYPLMPNATMIPDPEESGRCFYNRRKKDHLGGKKQTRIEKLEGEVIDQHSLAKFFQVFILNNFGNDINKAYTHINKIVLY